MVAVHADDAVARCLHCWDIRAGTDVRVRVFHRDPRSFTAGLAEARALHTLQQLVAHDPDRYRVLHLLDHFVFEGRVFIVQLLELLHLLHSFELTHGHLVPENVFVHDYALCDVRVAGFRSKEEARAVRSFVSPEEALGFDATAKSDLWALGCLLLELRSGGVPFFRQSSTRTLLAAMASLFGPLPEHMLEQGPLTPQYFTAMGVVRQGSTDNTGGEPLVGSAMPRNLSLKEWSSCGGAQEHDALLLSFVSDLLQLDPDERPSAESALQHPWLKHSG
eukprot:g8159.t1